MIVNETASTFAFDSPQAATAALIDRLTRVDAESLSLDAATGRVLAERIHADRPSPACDVSAMDGYAVRLIDLNHGSLSVTGEVAMGQPPPSMVIGSTLRIFTGSPVPEGCDAVIPREQVTEHADRIDLLARHPVKAGQHIRRCGENGQAGEMILDIGTPIHPAVTAVLAATGIANPRVYRRVRLAAIVTGNEVQRVDADVKPWQLRDSNGPTLASLFAMRPWIDWQGIVHVRDDRAALQRVIASALANCDGVLLTGGVSMGDYDFVPSVLGELGCDIVFHKLPLRPGKPVLAAVGPHGQAVLALPGNPVSVMTTARRIAMPALRHRAGYAQPAPLPATVMLTNPDDKRLSLHWSRPVQLIGQGEARLISTRGSGDIIGTARSDGFVEVPANQTGPGPWPFYQWSDNDA